MSQLEVVARSRSCLCVCATVCDCACGQPDGVCLMEQAKEACGPLLWPGCCDTPREKRAANYIWVSWWRFSFAFLAARFWCKKEHQTRLEASKE